MTGQYINSVFTFLLNRLHEKKVFVSLLPFARNIIEYSEGMACNEYKTLTCCLHLKADTVTIDGTQLLALYNAKLPKTIGKTIAFSSQNIKDIIYDVAEDILNDTNPDEVAIENKISLSMAIRMKSEEFMIGKLPAAFNVEAITKNQTKVLYDEVVKLGTLNSDTMRILDRVILMTPENIHINAFMYEPLIDMSLFHLKDLYVKVKLLT